MDNESFKRRQVKIIRVDLFRHEMGYRFPKLRHKPWYEVWTKTKRKEFYSAINTFPPKSRGVFSPSSVLLLFDDFIYNMLKIQKQSCTAMLRWGFYIETSDFTPLIFNINKLILSNIGYLLSFRNHNLKFTCEKGRNIVRHNLSSKFLYLPRHTLKATGLIFH